MYEYRVIQTTTSVGYGDTPVVTTMEIIIAILLMAIGVFAFSYLMGNMSSILSEIDGQKRKLQVSLSVSPLPFPIYHYASPIYYHNYV